jgi:Spy/CpxP family protein refolding chaperone
MNQPSRSKVLASFVGLASICLVATSCTTSTTTSPSTASSPATSESSASGGSASPDASTASGGTDANPISVGLDKSNRSDADPLQLIQSDQLKTELKITADQSAKLKEVENDLRAKVTEKNASANLKGLDAKAKEEKLKKIGEELNAETKTSREKIATILKPDQIKRMKEIFLQIYGLGPLNYPDFQTELKLTAEQIKQIDALKETMLTEMRAGWQIPPDDPTKQAAVLSENRKRLDGIAKNARAKTEALLTAEQKKTLETLKGATFNFKPTKAEK